MSENDSNMSPKNFIPPSGTTKVNCRNLTDWIDKAWFPQLIENSFCLIREKPDEIPKVGKIEAILRKVRSYQLLGKSTNRKLQSWYDNVLLDSGSNLNRKTNRWLKVVVQDDFQTVQELKFNEISAIFIVDRSVISLTLVCYKIHVVILKNGKTFLDKAGVYLRLKRSLRNWLQSKKFQSRDSHKGLVREIPHLKRSKQIVRGIGVVVNR